MPMKVVAADETELNEYGLPELPFIIPDPENIRYVTGSAQFAYIKEDGDTVGFIVFCDEGEQLFIYYLVFDEIPKLKAEAFVKEFCSGKEVFALTYDCNVASEIFDSMGFNSEPGLQYMDMNHIPPYESSPELGLEYVPIPLSKVPSKVSKLYNKCFSVTDGKKTMEKFVEDPFSKTGTTIIARKEDRNIGFWVDVTYFENMCFNCWIGIVPQQRRKGHGAHLMEYALTLAKKNGCTQAGLLVNPQNEAAVKFYEHLGFVRKWGRIHFQSEQE